MFIASYACPAVMAPSPITETTWFFFPSKSLPTAIPEKHCYIDKLLLRIIISSYAKLDDQLYDFLQVETKIKQY